MPIDVSRGTTNVSTLLPKEITTEIWSNTLEQSAVLQASRRIQVPGAGITIPMITGEPVANWVAETDEKPVSRPTIGTKSMTPYKMAVIEPFSNEFKRDLPTLYSELVRRLPFALATKFDRTVFGVDSAPGSGFDTLASAPAATVDATNTAQDLAAVFATLGARRIRPSHWVVSPAFEALLISTQNTVTGQPYFVADYRQAPSVGTLFGAPVLPYGGELKKSTSVGDDTGIVGDFTGSATVGIVENITIKTSTEATLTDGESTINLWQRNMFAVMAEFEVGFFVRDVNNFVRLTDGAVDTP